MLWRSFAYILKSTCFQFYNSNSPNYSVRVWCSIRYQSVVTWKSFLILSPQFTCFFVKSSIKLGPNYFRTIVLSMTFDLLYTIVCVYVMKKNQIKLLYLISLCSLFKVLLFNITYLLYEKSLVLVLNCMKFKLSLFYIKLYVSEDIR